MLVTVVRSIVGEPVDIGVGKIRPWNFVELTEVDDAMKEKLAELVAQRKVTVSQLNDLSVEHAAGQEGRMTAEQLGLADAGSNEDPEKVKEDNASKPDVVSDASKPNLVNSGEDPLKATPNRQASQQAGSGAAPAAPKAAAQAGVTGAAAPAPTGTGKKG